MLTRGSDSNALHGGLDDRQFSESLGLKVQLQWPRKGLSVKKEEAGRVGDILKTSVLKHVVNLGSQLE